jgi:hypothetical protein
MNRSWPSLWAEMPVMFRECNPERVIQIPLCPFRQTSHISSRPLYRCSQRSARAFQSRGVRAVTSLPPVSFISAAPAWWQCAAVPGAVPQPGQAPHQSSRQERADPPRASMETMRPAVCSLACSCHEVALGTLEQPRISSRRSNLLCRSPAACAQRPQTGEIRVCFGRLPLLPSAGTRAVHLQGRRWSVPGAGTIGIWE